MSVTTALVSEHAKKLARVTRLHRESHRDDRGG
jgi:hypothetical protein